MRSAKKRERAKAFSALVFLFCALFLRQAGALAGIGSGKTVVVDAWFNSQQREVDGQMVYFHYKWGDSTNTGFSLLGEMFRSDGAELSTLYAPPTVAALHGFQIYIIASPDNLAKNPHPHYVQPEDAEQVAEWVRGGGLLVLMENDPANADIDHMNLLAGKFGIHFNSVLSHHVVGSQIENGRISVSGDGPVFHHAHTLYMKDTCTISVTEPAVPLIVDKTGIVMAMANYGRGTVVAVVDPWLYNEYTNGKNLPAEYDNYAAGEEWVRWLLEQVPEQKSTGK